MLPVRCGVWCGVRGAVRGAGLGAAATGRAVWIRFEAANEDGSRIPVCDARREVAAKTLTFRGYSTLTKLSLREKN